MSIVARHWLAGWTWSSRLGDPARDRREGLCNRGGRGRGHHRGESGRVCRAWHGVRGGGNAGGTGGTGSRGRGSSSSAGVSNAGRARAGLGRVSRSLRAVIGAPSRLLGPERGSRSAGPTPQHGASAHVRAPQPPQQHPRRAPTRDCATKPELLIASSRRDYVPRSGRAEDCHGRFV